MAKKRSIVIVGAGLCGLVAATRLQKDFKVSILDKGFGLGGRLASRRLRDGDEELGFFDYGMQSFTATDSEFQSWVQSLIRQNVVARWEHVRPDANGNEKQFEQARYRGVESNRAIAQYLARELHVINQTRVETIAWDNAQWRLQTTDGRIFNADAVLMTAPVPQVLDIFSQSNFHLPKVMRSQLNQVAYAPCLSLMAVFEQASSIPEPGGLQLNDSILYWIASNHKKGISHGYAVTLLGSPKYSQVNWDRESEKIIAEMLNAAKEWVRPETAIATRLHRWKYSYPIQVFGARSARVDDTGPLILAGDAFREAPVRLSQSLESAYLSAVDAMMRLKTVMKI